MNSIILTSTRYPSLLESSDVDGGSSVAVLTYLRRILEALDHPDMIHLILHYLLALPDTVMTASGSIAAVSAARKRKSMDLMTMMKTQDEGSTPALYNLVDLIQGSLRSHNEQTISVTLQLVSSILRRHHRYAVTTLLWTSQVHAHGAQRTIGAHEMETESLLTLAGNIGGDDNFDEIYENHIKDCMAAIESHPCSVALIAPKSTNGTSKYPGSQASIPGAPRDLRSHTLSPDDPMLRTILTILATFFTNAIETNLSLTGTIVDLATCGYMRIDGWLLPDPSKYVYENDEEDSPEPAPLGTLGEDDFQERKQLEALKKARRAPKRTESQIPAILMHLKQLVDQVLAYRTEIPRFDELLQQRREAFQAASSANATPIPARFSTPRSGNDSAAASRSSSPPRPSALDSLAQRIFPELGTPSRSRAQSPRGRNPQEMTTGGYGLGTPTIKRDGPSPPQFPMSQETSRGSSRAFSPSPLRDNNQRFRGDSVRDSQVAAFAAIDQNILTRKVTQPVPKATVGAIPFPNLRSESGEGSTGVGSERDTENDSTLDSDAEGKQKEDEEDEQKYVSVNHVLTNIIVFQEFLLELAALVQVRAGLFGEVRYV